MAVTRPGAQTALMSSTALVTPLYEKVTRSNSTPYPPSGSIGICGSGSGGSDNSRSMLTAPILPLRTPL